MSRLRYWARNVLAGRIKCSKCCVFCRFYQECRMDTAIFSDFRKTMKR